MPVLAGAGGGGGRGRQRVRRAGLAAARGHLGLEGARGTSWGWHIDTHNRKVSGRVPVPNPSILTSSWARVTLRACQFGGFGVFCLIVIHRGGGGPPISTRASTWGNAPPPAHPSPPDMLGAPVMLQGP